MDMPNLDDEFGPMDKDSSDNPAPSDTAKEPQIQTSGRSAAVDFPRNTRATSPNNRAEEPPTIPRQLIFTYKYNLLSPKEDDPPFDANDPFTLNVMNTFEQYERNIGLPRTQENIHYQNISIRRKLFYPSYQTPTALISLRKLSLVLSNLFIRKEKANIKLVFAEQPHYIHTADIILMLTQVLYVIQPINFDSLEIPTVISDALGQLRLRTMNLENCAQHPATMTLSPLQPYMIDKGDYLKRSRLLHHITWY